MKKTQKLIIGLILINLGVFVVAAACLPQKGSFIYYGPFSHFINSRHRWDIPWVVTLGTALISVGGMFLFRKHEER